jgi:hypothetical protein
MQASRERGTPAADARRMPAGIMDSKNGNESATPAPRSTVRRERCFFVRYRIAAVPPRPIQVTRIDRLRQFGKGAGIGFDVL